MHHLQTCPPQKKKQQRQHEPCYLVPEFGTEALSPKTLKTLNPKTLSPKPPPNYPLIIRAYVPAIKDQKASIKGYSTWGVLVNPIDPKQLKPDRENPSSARG